MAPYPTLLTSYTFSTIKQLNLRWWTSIFPYIILYSRYFFSFFFNPKASNIPHLSEKMSPCFFLFWLNKPLLFFVKWPKESPKFLCPSITKSQIEGIWRNVSVSGNIVINSCYVYCSDLIWFIYNQKAITRQILFWIGYNFQSFP